MTVDVMNLRFIITCFILLLLPPKCFGKSIELAASSERHDAGQLAHRVTVYAVSSGNIETVPLPTPASDWVIRYQYVVPPIPDSLSWDPSKQTFYIWGDIDFDAYGSSGKFPISKYRFNQIVPQLMLGRSLAGNNAKFEPSWTNFHTWVIQACYFWQDVDGKFYAQTGRAVPVVPGEQIVTEIQYIAKTKEVVASIYSGGIGSTIIIPKPFPNEEVPIFSDWADFFDKAIQRSGNLFGRPMGNVETKGVEQSTLCSILPWRVGEVTIPFIRVNKANFRIGQVGAFACDTATATLEF
ncbi:MAG TPA: hypothetical protein VNT30_17090 [Stellaceae bacterium]|nr:hypothetical protein [Stellaceae bacterium]